ncbi:MAG TPA: hypothetical protein VKX16_10940 [Chloroflexota bacterium]|nr:hypothetical protein [Chloroflexota bacterium]
MQRSDLERKDVVALALVRLLEMLGEAVSGVSPALQMRYPKIL